MCQLQKKMLKKSRHLKKGQNKKELINKLVSSEDLFWLLIFS